MDTQLESKWIAGFEGMYSIREDGAIRSHDRFVPHGHSNKTRLIKGRWMRAGKTKKGYHCLVLRKDGKNHNVLVHRLVAYAFVEGFNPSLEVNHKDGNKDNNHKDNLEYVTCQENIDHAWAMGLYAAVGEKR